MGYTSSETGHTTNFDGLGVANRGILLVIDNLAIGGGHDECWWWEMKWSSLRRRDSEGLEVKNPYPACVQVEEIFLLCIFLQGLRSVFDHPKIFAFSLCQKQGLLISCIASFWLVTSVKPMTEGEAVDKGKTDKDGVQHRVG